MRSSKNHTASVLLVAVLHLLPATALADLAGAIRRLAGKDGVVYAVNAEDQVLVNIGGARSFVPASVIKIFTVLLAAHELGLEYRFTTEFFVDRDHLVVRGKGDPFLVSEELDLIAAALAPKLVGRTLRGVMIDDSYFEDELRLPGVGRTANPYDALNTATAVNFNTIAVIRRGGEIFSGEPQTPLTPLARALAAARGVRGATRFQIGDRPEEVRRYAGELIAAKLRLAGVRIGTEVSEGRAPQARPLYVHANSRALDEVCKELLRSSSNYIANQIFLAVGAGVFGPPASLEKSVAVARRYVAAHPGLEGLQIVEGSGIAYDNRATARSVATLLALFEPHRHLLKLEQGTRHKTGTLRTSSTLAGYLETKSHGTVRYVIALDGQGHLRRWKIVQMMTRAWGESGT